MPPVGASAKSVDQNNDSRTWNTSLLQNGARMSGAFMSQANLSDEQYKRLKAETEENYVGSRKAGKFMLLEGGLTWQEMSINPKDMDWLEGLKLSAREIAICYSVPPELIGDGSNKTYSNYQEARKAFYQETVLPMLDYLRDELNNWLVPLYGGNIYLDYNSDEIEALQEDRDHLYARVQAAYVAGMLTRNEAREFLGLAQDDTDPSSTQFRAPSASIIPAATSAPGDAPKSLKGRRADELNAAHVSIKGIMGGYFAEQRDACLKNLEEHYGA